ncbi:MAG: 3'(2'),5'-bisphosphate nucleotidase CysQ [Neomegalonema sp.]|nr:3'(2'),5'-bisphosphate nucleotidase CysQ [Neomegalonema sp.]
MPLSSPAQDRALLVAAVRQAGPIALNAFVQGQAANTRIWDKGGDLGLLTETDLAVNQALRELLLSERPDYGWLSEEDADDPARLSTARQFIVDPIDGTRSFAEGKPEFCLSVAVAEHGRVIAGAIFAPALDALFEAAIGEGARKNGTPIHTTEREVVDGARILATRMVRQHAHWDGSIPSFELGHVHPIAYRLCLVAEGAWDGLIALRGTNEWDVAAGDLIVREARGWVSDQRGRPFQYNKTVPRVSGAIAAGRALHRDLRRRMPNAPEIAR